jgi:hypothetical protein
MAEMLVGTLYELGQGVPQDYSEAFKWYRLAAGLVYFRCDLGGVLSFDVMHMRWGRT